MTDKLKEDTVSADRKERIIFDPDAWRKSDKSGRKTSAITSRQNFDNEKFTRKANKEEQVDEGTIQPNDTSKIEGGGPEQSDTISQDKKAKKSNNPQIEFVTGTANPNGSSSTAIGNAQNMGIKKISEALVKKAIKQVKVDKNTGTEELPFDPDTTAEKEFKKPHNPNRSPMDTVRALAQKAMKKQTNEEVERLDELSPETEHSYFKKAYDQKNDKTVPKATRQKRNAGMNKVINRTLRRNTISTPGASQDFKDQEARRGIGHVRDHVELEGDVISEAGQIDELSKVTLGSYVNKATKSNRNAALGHAQAWQSGNDAERTKTAKTMDKREKGIGSAVNRLADEYTGLDRKELDQIAETKAKLNKEGNEMSKTYTEFLEQLLEYTPGPGGVTRVQGRSYGAQYHDPEGDDDADDRAPAAKPADAPKRGRGRPAGSKSGANQKVTTGKSYGGIATHSLHLPNSNR